MWLSLWTGDRISPIPGEGDARLQIKVLCKFFLLIIIETLPMPSINIVRSLQNGGRTQKSFNISPSSFIVLHVIEDNAILPV